MTFGGHTFRPLGPRPVPLTPAECWPGREVRYRDRRCKVSSTYTADTPSGGRVTLALVTFPKGASMTVFVSDLCAADE